MSEGQGLTVRAVVYVPERRSEISTSEFAVIAGIVVVAVFLAASVLITPDRGPKEDGDDQKDADG